MTKLESICSRCFHLILFILIITCCAKDLAIQHFDTKRKIASTHWFFSNYPKVHSFNTFWIISNQKRTQNVKVICLCFSATWVYISHSSSWSPYKLFPTKPSLSFLYLSWKLTSWLLQHPHRLAGKVSAFFTCSKNILSLSRFLLFIWYFLEPKVLTR